MNNPSPDLITDAHIHQQLNENHLSHKELFRRLQQNADGKIEVDQLIELLEKHGLETSDQNRSDTVRVNFSIFIEENSLLDFLANH